MKGQADGPLLGKERITALLAELGRRCAALRFSVDMFVVGGGAIALAYSGERVTRDIDAIFEPKMVVYEEARLMADELELPQDWLNDGVKGLLPDVEDRGRQFTIESEGIRVVVPSPEYLFAMKAVAARISVDDDDLRLLGKRIGITTLGEAYEIVDSYYRRERISAKSGFFLQAIFPETGARAAQEPDD